MSKKVKNDSCDTYGAQESMNNNDNNTKHGIKHDIKHNIKYKPKKTLAEYNITFQRNDYALRKVACQVIAQRRVDIRNCEIYKKVSISRSAFYEHYYSCTQIRNTIEHDLYFGFKRRYRKWKKISSFLVILVEFVFEHPIYFRTMHRANDHYLLTKILLRYRVELVGNNSDIDDRTFKLYVRTLECIIDNYMEFSDNSPAAALECAEHMRLVRPKRYWRERYP